MRLFLRLCKRTLLKKAIVFRKDDSIRGQIRRFVLTTLTDNGDQDAEKIVKHTMEIYDLRSDLVHKGKLEKEKDIAKAILDIKSTGLTQNSRFNTTYWVI